MPDFASLWGPNRKVAESLYGSHSDWMKDRIRYLSGHYEREEAIDIFAEDLEDFVQRLFDEAERKISPVVVACLAEWEPRPTVNLEQIAWFFFEEYWPKGSKPKASANIRPRKAGTAKKPAAGKTASKPKTKSKSSGNARSRAKASAGRRARCSDAGPRHPRTPSRRSAGATSTWTTC